MTTTGVRQSTVLTPFNMHVAGVSDADVDGEEVLANPPADASKAVVAIIDTGGDYNSPDNWRASCEYNGSPGSAGIGSDGRIVINEVLTHTDLPQTDSIELYNTTAGAINIGGWVLSDDNGVYQSFSIPSANMAAGSYTTFDESQFNVTPTNTRSASIPTHSTQRRVWTRCSPPGTPPRAAWNTLTRHSAAKSND